MSHTAAQKASEGADHQLPRTGLSATADESNQAAPARQVTKKWIGQRHNRSFADRSGHLVHSASESRPYDALRALLLASFVHGHRRKLSSKTTLNLTTPPG